MLPVPKTDTKPYIFAATLYFNIFFLPWLCIWKCHSKVWDSTQFGSPGCHKSRKIGGEIHNFQLKNHNGKQKFKCLKVNLNKGYKIQKELHKKISSWQAHKTESRGWFVSISTWLNLTHLIINLFWRMGKETHHGKKNIIKVGGVIIYQNPKVPP